MARQITQQRILGRRFRKLAALLLLAGTLSSCKQPESSKPVQKTFTSPEDAGAAFYQAAKANDKATLFAIFGENSENVLLSGDAVKDKDTLLGFVASYDQMHRWRDMKAGGQILYVGADNLWFPGASGPKPIRPVVLRYSGGQG